MGNNQITFSLQTVNAARHAELLVDGHPNALHLTVQLLDADVESRIDSFQFQAINTPFVFHDLNRAAIHTLAVSARNDLDFIDFHAVFPKRTQVLEFVGRKSTGRKRRQSPHHNWLVETCQEILISVGKTLVLTVARGDNALFVIVGLRKSDDRY